MPPQTKREFCVGSSSFHPHQYQQDAQIRAEVEQLLLKNDLFNASRVLFSLPQDDTYVYHAMASVRLREVQHVIGLGRSNGLHAWYRNEDDNNSVVRTCCTTLMEPILTFCRGIRHPKQISVVIFLSLNRVRWRNQRWRTSRRTQRRPLLGLNAPRIWAIWDIYTLTLLPN